MVFPTASTAGPCWCDFTAIQFPGVNSAVLGKPGNFVPVANLADISTSCVAGFPPNSTYAVDWAVDTAPPALRDIGVDPLRAGDGYGPTNRNLLSEGSHVFNILCNIILHDPDTGEISVYQTSNFSVPFDIDLTPPVITVSTPVADSVVGFSTFGVSGFASDLHGIREISISAGNGGVNLSTSSGTFDFAIDPAQLGFPGSSFSSTFTISAMDWAAPANISTKIVSLTIDAVAPQIAISTPSLPFGTGNVSPFTFISGTAIDNFVLGDHIRFWAVSNRSGRYWNGSGFVAQNPVEIDIPFDGGTPIGGEEGTWTYAAITATKLITASSYTIMAQAVDTAGNFSPVASSTFTFGSITLAGLRMSAKKSGCVTFSQTPVNYGQCFYLCAHVASDQKCNIDPQKLVFVSDGIQTHDVDLGDCQNQPVPCSEGAVAILSKPAQNICLPQATVTAQVGSEPVGSVSMEIKIPNVERATKFLSSRTDCNNFGRPLTPPCLYDLYELDFFDSLSNASMVDIKGTKTHEEVQYRIPLVLSNGTRLPLCFNTVGSMLFDTPPIISPQITQPLDSIYDGNGFGDLNNRNSSRCGEFAFQTWFVGSCAFPRMTVSLELSEVTLFGAGSLSTQRSDTNSPVSRDPSVFPHLR